MTNFELAIEPSALVHNKRIPISVRTTRGKRSFEVQIAAAARVSFSFCL